jgi:hypothetical protein
MTMHPLLVTGLQMAAPLIKKRIEKKFIEGVINEGIESQTEKTEVSYEGIDKRKSAAWVAVAVVGITFASSQGWIAPELAQALLDLVQNEAVQEAVNEAASGE